MGKDLVPATDKEIQKEIDIYHGHKVRNHKGEIVKKLKRGVAHIHTSKGGRENNMRYLTKKEIKLFGEYIKYIGGKISE